MPYQFQTIDLATYTHAQRFRLAYNGAAEEDQGYVYDDTERYHIQERIEHDEATEIVFDDGSRVLISINTYRAVQL
jgi:hypothetical protein